MKEKSNIKLILEYDGSAYHGWQRQKGDITIQGVIEEKIHTMTGEAVSLIGSGRTDAGVHALNQVCNFITGSKIAPESFRRGLNSLLPEDIIITKAEYVPIDFHSRYSVKSKTYEYRIWNKRKPDVFLRKYTWHVWDDLDIEKMKNCLSMLLGKHDFSAFKSSGSGNRDPVREMIRTEITRPKEGVLFFIFEANGFLRHMVRNIMGSVIDVGRGKLDVCGFEEVFQSKDKCNIGIKAPPQGLFLAMVNY